MKIVHIFSQDRLTCICCTLKSSSTLMTNEYFQSEKGKLFKHVEILLRKGLNNTHLLSTQMFSVSTVMMVDFVKMLYRYRQQTLHNSKNLKATKICFQKIKKP